jgi:hypothetical protein
MKVFFRELKKAMIHGEEKQGIHHHKYGADGARE